MTALMQEKCLIQHVCEFGCRNENILWIKVVYFKKSCLTNCENMLNFANFKIGDTNIQRGILYVLLNIFQNLSYLE